ncbi:metalloendopeptidase [Ascochyta rabiei]|uniref:Metalloendopeptidase n=2 Tax=Didymella rabiei TaxID=5454 RepID=A0A163ME44_DIDRA|nr:metalloendopeptidase [Ascochyta rabiei]
MYASCSSLTLLSALVSITAAYPSSAYNPAPNPGIRKLSTVDIRIAPKSHDKVMISAVSNSSNTRRLSYFVQSGLAITHGDVIYSSEDELLRKVKAQKRSLSYFADDKESLWPSARIEYKWQSEDAKGQGRQEAWEEATKRWTDMLPFVKFSENPAGDAQSEDVVTLVPTENTGSCFSPIGKAQNSQSNQIMLDSECGGAGTYTHELGHTLGLFHEHMRPDRDEYVTINCANVMQSDEGPNNCGENCSGYGCNFQKLPKDRADWSGPYDSLSIMHYSPDEFANGNGPAIVAKPGVPTPRRHTFPTAQDAKRVCSLYQDQCKGVCGDGKVEPGNGEECDDGNNQSGDGCSSDCKKE